MFMTRYSVKSECLAPWVKFIWHFSDENASVFHKLLPTDCIDIVLNLSNNMVYEIDSHKIIAPLLHINGLRNEHSYIYQSGTIHIFGISFYAYGMFPFVHKSLEHIQNKIVDLHTLSIPLAQKLKLIDSYEATEEAIAFIEKTLCSELQVNDNEIYKAKLINDFMQTDDSVTIQSFCNGRNITIKTFERMLLHRTGYMPNILRRIKRFQSASNQLVHQNQTTLSSIAYDNSFTDQAHFTREFRRFSGVAPRTFQQEKITVKENAKYSYV